MRTISEVIAVNLPSYEFPTRTRNSKRSDFK